MRSHTGHLWGNVYSHCQSFQCHAVCLDHYSLFSCLDILRWTWCKKINRATTLQTQLETRLFLYGRHGFQPAAKDTVGSAAKVLSLQTNILIQAQLSWFKVNLKLRVFRKCSSNCNNPVWGNCWRIRRGLRYVFHARWLKTPLYVLPYREP